MFRKFAWLSIAVVVTFSVSDIVGCPPYPVGWTISNPVKDTLYTGSIAGAGEATSAENYIVKVVNRSVRSTVYTEHNGTSNCGSWQKDVPEPSGGWPPNMEAAFELWVSGVVRSEVDIKLNG